jgi:hypothetical protein
MNGKWSRGGEEPKDIDWEEDSALDTFLEEQEEAAVGAVEGGAVEGDDDEGAVHLRRLELRAFFRQAQLNDQLGRQLAHAAAPDQVPLPVGEEADDHADMAPQLVDGMVTVLCGENNRRVTYTPPSFRLIALRSAHDDFMAGHGGFLPTLLYLKRFHWWPSMRQDVQRYTQGCHACQTARVSQTPKGVKPKPITRAGESWQVDVMYIPNP